MTGKEGVELGLGSRGRAAVSGRLGVPEDLGERVPVDVVLRGRAARLAQAVDEERDGGSRPSSPCRCTPIDLTAEGTWMGAASPDRRPRAVESGQGPPRFLIDCRSPTVCHGFSPTVTAPDRTA